MIQLRRQPACDNKLRCGHLSLNAAPGLSCGVVFGRNLRSAARMTSSLNGIGGSICDPPYRRVKAHHFGLFSGPAYVVRTALSSVTSAAKRLESLALSHPQFCEADHILRKAQAYGRVVGVLQYLYGGRSPERDGHQNEPRRYGHTLTSVQLLDW